MSKGALYSKKLVFKELFFNYDLKQKIGRLKKALPIFYSAYFKKAIV
jgi:hypothetical protein